MIETEICADQSVRLRPFGDLDWMGAMSLRHVVHDALEPGMEMVIDLGEVRAVDVEGLSALAGTIRRVRSVDGRVRVVNVNPGVQDWLDHVGVTRLVLGFAAQSGDDAA